MNDPAIISKECVNILKPLKVLASDIRGIGIQVHKLEDNKSKPGTNISILNFTKQISNKQVNKNQAEVHLPYETGTSTQNELKSGSSTSTNSDDQNAKKTLFDIEIARRKMARKILPPLPALPTFDSPSVSGQIMGDRAASTPKYGMTAKPGDLILPSPSQVGCWVLHGRNSMHRITHLLQSPQEAFTKCSDSYLFWAASTLLLVFPILNLLPVN